MKLSPAAEMAVRGIIVLAQDYGAGPVAIKTICQRRGLAKQYLIKIFSLLVRAGLITAIRGKGGGYVLAKAPGEISLLQVIEAVEGTIALNYCQQDPITCDEVNCPIRPVWTALQLAVQEKLGGMTLADCICRQD